MVLGAAALARRRRDRRRRPLPPRARSQARRRSTPSRSSAVDEFADGGLHPGYAFPLWHGFLALVARVALLDPIRGRPARGRRARAARASRRLRGGYALFRRVGPAVAVVCAQVGVTALAPADGGAYTALALPGDGVAPAARPRGDRARVRVRRAAEPARARVRRRRGARPGGRPPDLRDLPLAAVRGLSRRPLAGRAGGVQADRRCARSARAPSGSRSSPGCFRSFATRPRTNAGADELQRAFSQYGDQLDRLSPTRAIGSRPRSSAGRGRSRSSRSSSCLLPGLRYADAGPRTFSAASSRLLR